MFKLRVRFQGHCTFAPKQDGSEAKVFLLNESEPRVGVLPHRGAIRVAAKYLSASTPALPGELFWFLTRQRIKIVPPMSDSQPPPLKIDGFNDLGTPREPSLVRRPKNDDHGFWWLAPLERVCLARQLQPGGGAIEKSFLPDKLDKYLFTGFPLYALHSASTAG